MEIGLFLNGSLFKLRPVLVKDGEWRGYFLAFIFSYSSFVSVFSALFLCKLKQSAPGYHSRFPFDLVRAQRFLVKVQSGFICSI